MSNKREIRTSPSEGNIRRLLWELKADETPQGFARGGSSAAHGKRSIFPQRWISTHLLENEKIQTQLLHSLHQLQW